MGRGKKANCVSLSRIMHSFVRSPCDRPPVHSYSAVWYKILQSQDGPKRHPRGGQRSLVTGVQTRFNWYNYFALLLFPVASECSIYFGEHSLPSCSVGNKKEELLQHCSDRCEWERRETEAQRASKDNSSEDNGSIFLSRISYLSKKNKAHTVWKQQPKQNKKKRKKKSSINQHWPVNVSEAAPGCTLQTSQDKKPVWCLTAARGFSCLIAVPFHFRSSKQLIRWTQFPKFVHQSLWEITRLELSGTGGGEKTIVWMEPRNEARLVDGEGMFVSGAPLLICKAHVNAGSVTCHLRGSESTGRVVFIFIFLHLLELFLLR